MCKKNINTVKATDTARNSYEGMIWLMVTDSKDYMGNSRTLRNLVVEKYKWAVQLMSNVVLY